MAQRTAVVVTVSDGVARGTRIDESGPAVVDVLVRGGFEVSQRVVSDDRLDIESVLREEAGRCALIVTTGGTGFALRDVTPEATKAVVERDAPGLAEAMRATGRASTPFSDLSRGTCGIVGETLVINLPGSPRGAVESLVTIVEIIGHALEHLSGATEHPEPA